jgi:purine-nucleoside phosphorylase
MVEMVKLREDSDLLKAEEFLRDKLPDLPSIAIILGSGFQPAPLDLKNEISLKYSEVPGFAVPSVEGHSGILRVGKYGVRTVALFEGRVHFYEGYDMSQVTLPVRVLGKLNCKTMIVANASGSTTLKLRPGTIVLINDHINLIGENPLRGLVDGFPDMSFAYDSELRALARKVARQIGIPVADGVYAGFAGPSYDTPAEVRMIARLGAQLVGMSTIPEVVAANAAGMKVLGISCVANYASGLTNGRLSHADVISNINSIKSDFFRLLCGILDKLPEV